MELAQTLQIRFYFGSTLPPLHQTLNNPGQIARFSGNNYLGNLHREAWECKFRNLYLDL
jgi:hypothetical protein